jgi:SOS-response transcriptional repressor LexA
MANRFADQLKSALSAQGLTKYRLAQVSGVSEGLLSRLASGKQLPSDETIDRLAPVLGVSSDGLKAAAMSDRMGEDALARLVAHQVKGDITALEVERTFDVSSSSKQALGTRMYRMHAVEEVQMRYAGRVGCGRRIELDQGATFGVLPELAALGDFCAHADGVSMTKAGIKDGDLLILRETSNPQDGDVVMASFNDDGSTVKRYRVSKGNGKQSAWLFTESLTEDVPPVLVDETVRINGVVVYVQPAGFAL